MEEIERIMQLTENFTSIVYSDEFLAWLVASALLLLALTFLIAVSAPLIARMKTKNMLEYKSVEQVCQKEEEIKDYIYLKKEAFFEILICNACIAVTMFTYDIFSALFINTIIQNILLLIFILIARLFNGIISKNFIIDIENTKDKADIRFVSSLGMLVIFLYIKYAFAGEQFNELLKCYILLVAGKFIFFDMRFEDFEGYGHAIKENIISLLFAFAYVFVELKIGFYYGVLSEASALLILLLLHVCMLLSIKVERNLEVKLSDLI